MKKYKRIDQKEREELYRLKQTGLNQEEIAEQMKRDPSSISRELARCKEDNLGYLPDRAQNHAKSKQKRYFGRFTNVELQEHVIEQLQNCYSPDQISGRLKLQKSHLQVSHETIYQFVYSETGQKLDLPKLLPRRHKKRRARYSRKPKRSNIVGAIPISQRPKSIEKRKQTGHWEGDLVIFRVTHSQNLTTLVERKSRYVKLILNPNKYSNNVIGGIKKTIDNLPRNIVKSITFDRGTEFASHKDLGVQTYFCNPHSPWQKGSNENFNGRLRRFLPKSFNPAKLSVELIDKIEVLMNNQPRKCLGYRTPIEALHKLKPPIHQKLR
jgi:IS30 family transposase